MWFDGEPQLEKLVDFPFGLILLQICEQSVVMVNKYFPENLSNKSTTLR